MRRHLFGTLSVLGGMMLVGALALVTLFGPGVSAQTATPPAVTTCAPATPVATATAVATEVAATMTASPEFATPTAEGCEVTIDMADIKFVPNDVTIPANTPVKVILHNVGALPHNFSITDHKNANVKNLKIDVTVDPGKSEKLTINAPAGDYYFFCDEPGHEAAGMFGTLHVK